MQHRITTLVRLGNLFSSLSEEKSYNTHLHVSEDFYDSWLELIRSVHVTNAWFTTPEVRRALGAWGRALDEDSIRRWSRNTNDTGKKTIGLVAAGNIPMVGLHDAMSIYISGNQGLLKLSRDDDRLIPQVLKTLQLWDNNVFNQLTLVDGKLQGFDAVIATGSNNTSRYFEQYFGKYPNIIRKSRSSVAILSGNETKEQLEALGNDIFSYFGMGCRSVTKVYFPKGYEVDVFFKGIYTHGAVIEHNKYGNNYDYHKATWLLNKVTLLDNGFVLLKEDKGLSSPLGSLFYEYYDNLDGLKQELSAREEEIQCMVGSGYVSFGQSQNPGLEEYADHINTLDWLNQL